MIKKIVTQSLVLTTASLGLMPADADAKRRYQTPYYYNPKQPYVAIGHHVGVYEEDGLDNSNPEGIRIEIGTYLDDDLAVEAHYVFGQAEDIVQQSSTDASGNVAINDIQISLQQVTSVFLKGDFPIANNFRLYGLLGYSDLAVQASSATTVNIVGNGLSYGVGVEGYYKNNLYWSADYIFYVNTQSSATYTGIGLSAHMRF